MAKMIDFSDIGNEGAAEGARARELSEAAEVKLYHLRATIVDSDPPIWREVVVPRDFTLQMLHETMLVLFEWDGDHLYFFENPRKKTFYDDPVEPVDEFARPEGEKHFPADEHTVKELLARKGSHARYVYDFGDYWEIEIEVLQTKDGDELPFPILPLCLGGEMRSPLEDIGGLDGWYNFCLTMEDPDDPQRAGFIEWAGFDEIDVAEFSEHAFTPRTANAEFAEVQIRAYPEVIPDEPGELRDLCCHLIADNMALEFDNMLMLSDAMGAMMDLANAFGADDEDIFNAMSEMLNDDLLND